MTVLEEDRAPKPPQTSSRKAQQKTGLGASQSKLSLKRKLPNHTTDTNSSSSGNSTNKRIMNGYSITRRNNGHIHESHTNSTEPPSATLSNMGNTCYLNSVLYTLRFAPTFLHNLHHLIGDLALVASRYKAKTASLGRTAPNLVQPGSRSTSSKDLLSLGLETIAPRSKVQLVTEKLHELFVTMHHLELKDSIEPYQPVALLQAVRDANSIFEGNHQQDAHELLVYLLDNIRETCDLLTQQLEHNPNLMQDHKSPLNSSNNSKFWSVRRSWKKTGTKKKPISEEEQLQNTDLPNSMDNLPIKKLGYNFVAEDFEGITLRRTKCLECEKVTERKEPFYDIPVPISLKDDNTSEGAERINPSDIYKKACVTTEKLCDSNKYLCDNCKRYNEASREVLFEKLPNIMVLQLKRFTTTAAGVQKVNTFLPTPLELECFCETCCKTQENQKPAHKYNLCCVIMHLGATMASGHYISYVRASDLFEDYSECNRDLPHKGTLISASTSEKSINILKYFKHRPLNTSLLEKNGLSGLCKSLDCCGVRMNKNNLENLVNSLSKKQDQDGLDHLADLERNEVWLECDDENVRPITGKQFEEELSFKPNSTSTPYLLFYTKTFD